MGLILGARSSIIFFGSVAYGKAGTAIEDQNTHSKSATMARFVLFHGMPFQKLCRRSRTRLVQMMITK